MLIECIGGEQQFKSCMSSALHIGMYLLIASFAIAALIICCCRLVLEEVCVDLMVSTKVITAMHSLRQCQVLFVGWWLQSMRTGVAFLLHTLRWLDTIATSSVQRVCRCTLDPRKTCVMNGLRDAHATGFQNAKAVELQNFGTDFSRLLKLQLYCSARLLLGTVHSSRCGTCVLLLAFVCVCLGGFG